MGTATNQIATRNDINAGKRRLAYDIDKTGSYNMYKCPTKGEINQIEFLDVKNTSTVTSENTYWNAGSAIWSYRSMTIESYSTTTNSYVSGGIPITPSNYEYCPMIITNSSPGYYYHSSVSQIFNISFNASVDDLDFNEFDNVEANSLCYKTISVTPGKYTNLRINYSTIAYANTKSAQSNYSFNGVVTPQNDDKGFGIIIALVDSNSEVIQLSDIDDFVGTSSYTNISFTPTTSSITIYIIPRYIDVSFYPTVSGNLYVGVGFNLGVKTTIYDSYYDTNSKLAQYEDIGEDSARKFGVYYGVWNNKSTPARVDYAKVLINTTSDTSATDWTEIGRVTLSDIAGPGYRSGVITCTLPTNVNLATTQYYLVVKVGDTLNNQDFYGGWGNAKEDVNYKHCRKSTSGWTEPVQLIPTKEFFNMNGGLTATWTSGQSVGVLNHIYINTNGSTNFVKGIYNTNPEYKGWIKIQ
jgi:hypothetical protein